MNKIVLAAFGLTMASSTAFAADLGAPRRGPAPPPPPLAVYQPTFTWSGLYVGVQTGYAWGETDATSFADVYDTDGFFGGGHLGYNWQVGKFVIGAETDLELADISGSDTFGFLHSTEIDWLGSLRGRLGYAVDRTLFYATGGLAYGDVTIASLGFSDTETRTGWTAGAGVEHAFAPHTTARLEYRYTDLGSGDVDFDESDVTFSAIRAGLSWKF